MFYHAPKVGPNEVPGFMKYCIAIADTLHEHHTIEETTIFPALEAKLGKGAMDGNVGQHDEFMPKFNKWAELCKKIAAKEAEYNATDFLGLFRTSTDILYTHFVDEILTIESSTPKKHFSEAELQEIENKIDKKAQEIALLWNIPLILVNSNLSFNSWFPPIPAPITFVARHVLMNFMGDMWNYGQCDKYMRLKDEFKPMYGL